MSSKQAALIAHMARKRAQQAPADKPIEQPIEQPVATSSKPKKIVAKLKAPVQVAEPVQPKKKITVKAKAAAAEPLHKYTLKQAVDFINELANAENTKLNYIRALTSLVANWKAPEVLMTKQQAAAEKAKERELAGDPELVVEQIEAPQSDYLTMKQDELYEKYAGTDMWPLLNNFDATVQVINNIPNKRPKKVMNTDAEEHSSADKKDYDKLSIDTIKNYYAAILTLNTNVGGRIRLDEGVMEKYRQKSEEYNNLSNAKRRLNEPKGANAEYPDFTMSKMLKEFDDFLTVTPFTNTKKGRNDLKNACIIGLYVLDPPRRATDYWLLQYYSKLPSEKERKGKNILHIEGKVAKVYIDVFKTRTRTVKNKTKELLPTYVTELHPKVSSLLRDYIKKCEIGDNSKLTKDEVKEGKEYFVFPDKNGNKFKNASGFTNATVRAGEAVFKRMNISANTFRHNFSNFITNNLKKFDGNPFLELAEAVGDKPKDLPTNLGAYRTADPLSKGKSAKEVLRELQEDALLEEGMFDAIMNGDENNRENVSKGKVNNLDDDDVVSPVTKNTTSADEVLVDNLLKALKPVLLRMMKH